MNANDPVTVIISFSIRPGYSAACLGLWKNLQEQARVRPACRRFEVLCDRSENKRCIALSEWDTAASFDAFVRDTGLTWIERCMDRMCDTLEYAVLEDVHFEDVQNDLYDIAPVPVRTLAAVHTS